MLPGYVSGFYTHDECHVDLNRLARYAGAALILEAAVGLDLQVCSLSPCQAVPIPQPQTTFHVHSCPRTSLASAVQCDCSWVAMVYINHIVSVHQVLPLCCLCEQALEYDR